MNQNSIVTFLAFLKWSLELRVLKKEGFLPNSFGGEFILFIKTYSYGGALTSLLMGEHSPPTFIFPILQLYSDPVIQAVVRYFCVQRVTLVQFWIGEACQSGGFRVLWKEWPQIWHTAPPNFHSLKLNIFGTQQRFVVSDCPQISFELGMKWFKYTFFLRMNDLHAMPITNITHNASWLSYSQVGCKCHRSHTCHTWQQPYSICAYFSAGLWVYQRLPPGTDATIAINACNHRQCWKSKWRNHR